MLARQDRTVTAGLSIASNEIKVSPAHQSPAVCQPVTMVGSVIKLSSFSPLIPFF